MARMTTGEFNIERNKPLEVGRQIQIAKDGKSEALVDRLKREVAVLREEVERLTVFQQMAYKDCLTGLYNRRYFEERLADECERANRIPEYIFSLMVIDIDDFKDINDSFGHAEGDRTLTAVAEFIRSNVRKMDLCCRLGGDEFAIVLPNAGADEASKVVDRLHKEFLCHTADGTIRTGLSIGFVTSDSHAGAPEVMMEAADLAMYRDKQRRKHSH